MARPDLTPILQHPAFWTAARQGAARPVTPTGHAALDRALHDGGWPQGALTELILPRPGCGELRLLQPLLRQAGQGGGWLVLAGLPFQPYLAAWQAAGIDPRALLQVQPTTAAEWLWTLEQSARAGCCPVILGWQGEHRLQDRDLRRLQLAMQQQAGQLFLIRPWSAREQASVAALRLTLQPCPEGLQVGILKQRGGWAGQSLILPLVDNPHPALPPRDWPLPRHQRRPLAPAAAPSDEAAAWPLPYHPATPPQPSAWH